MMDFSTLQIKTKPDGKIDLLSNFIEIDFDKVIIDQWILVDDSSAMLLDMISFAMYGTENYSDMLKKFNKIDNPFEINIGQVIAVPNMVSLQENMKVVVPQQIKNPIKRIGLMKRSNSQASQSPSKKTIPASNFIKHANGNLIF
jgi:hypothetical protein